MLAYESRQCPACGNYDTFVPLEQDRRNVVWAEHGGKKVEVRQFRCLTCGAADLVKRDAAERHKDDKSAAGKAAWGDGRVFAAVPLDDD